MQPELAGSRTTRMHHSLIKLSEVIQEDPKEDEVETPKHNSKKVTSSHVMLPSDKKHQTSKLFSKKPLFRSKKTDESNLSKSEDKKSSRGGG